MQIMHGNVISTIEKDIDLIAHFHAAGVPGRHELTIGELNYGEIISRIAKIGYQGCFGLEYLPSLSDNLKSLTDARAFVTRWGQE